MKRWKKRIATALVVLTGVSGCQQQLYMTHDDHKAVTMRGLPTNLDSDPAAVAPVLKEVSRKPPTVNDPDREVWYISLPEAISIALEQGNVGNENVSGFIATGEQLVRTSVYFDQGTTFSGNGANVGDNTIRAYALDPAIFGADIEGALSKFDVRWLTSMAWSKSDNAVVNVFNNLQNGDTASFSSGLYKPLPTGGLAGITFNTDYNKLSSVPAGFAVVNPAYRPSLRFDFEQPLLRDFGIFINQLRPSHPGSTQIQGLGAISGRGEGILLTRLRYDQSRAEFERRVNAMLFNVENAYWNLYGAYFALYAADQGVRQSYITWQLTKAKFESGTSTAHEVAQVRAQFEQFRARRLNAMAQVHEFERQFRGLLNLPVDDGKRIVPADEPTLAPYTPDYSLAVNEMLVNKPDLTLLRQEVKARQMNVLLQKNFLRPDLRFFANYNINAIGTRLDGSGPDPFINDAGNALAALSDNKFNTWTLGFRMDTPIGFRDANAAVRAAQLALARSYETLKNSELRSERFLAVIYQGLESSYAQITAQRERRLALAQQLEGLYARFKAGKDPLLNLLVAQSDFADALRNEHFAIANYNLAIAAFQLAKGTIMQYNNIVIADGPLPHCAYARAAEHFRERTAGRVLRERESVPSPEGGNALPALLERQPPVPEKLGEPMPVSPLPSAPTPKTPADRLPIPLTPETTPMPKRSTPATSPSPDPLPNLRDVTGVP